MLNKMVGRSGSINLGWETVQFSFPSIPALCRMKETTSRGHHHGLEQANLYLNTMFHWEVKTQLVSRRTCLFVHHYLFWCLETYVYWGHNSGTRVTGILPKPARSRPLKGLEGCSAPHPHPLYKNKLTPVGQQRLAESLLNRDTALSQPSDPVLWSSPLSLLRHYDSPLCWWIRTPLFFKH